MKMWKKILIVVAAIVVLATACFFSWSYGFRSGLSAGGMTTEMAELMLFDRHMADQITNANCEGAKQAINNFLKMLEKYRNVKGTLITNTSYYGDKMLCHIRLARIENRLGNHTEEAKHVEMAKEACAQRKWTDCSEEKIIWFAKRIEEKNPIACLANEK